MSYRKPHCKWSGEAPKKPGVYWMTCEEADEEPELVTVDYYKGDGVLWAVECAIGSLPVSLYHDNLTDCYWQEAEPMPELRVVK